MEKSPEAFRTISEVAELLDTPAHVLRFWESRFPQIRPVKRAGGRRYYRPGDVALLSGIKRLLHDEGMTIRGVQKILREQGIRHVASLAPGDLSAADTPEDEALRLAQAAFPPAAEPDTALAPEAAQTAQIISLEAALQRQDGTRPVAAQQSLWPDDPETIAAPSPSSSTTPWPHDPADETEAPFVEVDDTTDSFGHDTGAELARIGHPDAQTEYDAAEQNEQESATDPANGATSESLTNGDESPAAADAPLTAAALLRRANAVDLLHRQAELQVLLGRAVDLRDRLALASRRRAR